MESIVAAALESGALGLSTGLCYKPGLYAQEDEVVALVRLAARRRAVYATHIRDEAGGGQEALEEAVRTARRAEATALHICHLKAAGRAAWGTGLARLEWTRRTAGPGIRVTADLYPYTASSSTLDYLVPPEAFRALSGGSQPGTAGFRRAVDLTLEKLRRDGWEDYAHVRLAQSPRHREWVGRKISEIVTGSVRDQAAWILRHQARGNIQIISEEMNENDVRALLRAPDVVFGSDSSVRYRGMGRPHPRGAGTFPRVFAEYVRNLRLLALEDAVRRATSLPAEIFAISDRGLIREGFWADLVIFDPARIQDRATAEDPWQHPEGIAYVIVNGTVVARNGKVTGALPGRTVRRTHAEVPQPAGR
jgi:dihydroorotase/N-acyl-D-amino-acid deacylase